MKKTLTTTVVIMLFLTLLISCGSGTPPRTSSTKDVNYATFIPDTMVSFENGEGGVTYGDKQYKNKSYAFKSKYETSKLDLPDKTIELFGITYTLKYELTAKNLFQSYYTDLYYAYDNNGNSKNISVHYLSGTNKILGFSSGGEIDFDETERNITSKDDLVSYAKTVASRYIDISKYELVIESHSIGHCKQYNFYKLLDGYRTSEYISFIIRERDGALTGIRSYCLGSYDEFQNVKFDKESIEALYKDREIDSITILNDEGTLVAEVAFYVDKQSWDGSIRKVIKKSYVPLIKQNDTVRSTTAKVTTAAPITTLPPDTGSYCTTAPAEPILKPQG